MGRWNLKLASVKSCDLWHEVQVEDGHWCYSEEISDGSSTVYCLMTWMMGQRKPSISLQMLQNWEDCLVISDGCAAFQRDWHWLENMLT